MRKPNSSGLFAMNVLFKNQVQNKQNAATLDCLFPESHSIFVEHVVKDLQHKDTYGDKCRGATCEERFADETYPKQRGWCESRRDLLTIAFRVRSVL